ncbi:MAG: hypothetical protein PF637_07630 [Spirochaetes bacterium]|jgi:predicted transposase/invertase (TIGR01784 family)|nr:hypothetical protein [Spirochaetota bacterium]
MGKEEIVSKLDVIFKIMEKEKPDLLKLITLFIRNYFQDDEDLTDVMNRKNVEEKEAKEMLSQTIERWKDELVTEGIGQGERHKAIESARSMLNDGMPVQQIAKYTGLSVDEIESLKI